MAKKGKHKPSAKAKKAYYKMIENGYERTRAALLKHNPGVVKKHEK